MTNKSPLFTLVTFATLSCAGFANAQNLDGLYQPSGSSWSCSPDQVGMDGGALSIQGGVINGVENRCDLTVPIDTGNGTRFTAVCSTEGSTYEEPILISPTRNGVSIERGGDTVYWTRCEDPQTTVDSQSATDVWSFGNRSASIISGGNSFALSCDTFNASSTYPTATMSAPCPSCFPTETSMYTLRVDDLFSQNYEFERISNAEGSMSGLDYYPNWNEGLLPALMAGSVLEVVEQGNTIATFPLTGSSRSIDQLRQQCN
ncbi:MAG: hypothetical protein ABJL72_18135 [Roseobacter sp.]